MIPLKRRTALLRRVLMGIGVLSLVLICAFLMLETPESGEKPQQQDAGARAEALFCAPITENGHNDASASGKSDGGEKPQPKPEENAQGLSAPKATATDANGNWVISSAYIRELSALFPPGDLPI